MSAYKVIKQAEKTVVLEDNLLLPLEKIKTPSYVLDEAKLNDNASVCKRIIKSSGCSILLALKAFSTLKGLAVFKDVLNGVTCSSLNEVKLV